jgi:hypothetical protein
LFTITWAVELNILSRISPWNPFKRESAIINAATPMAMPIMETNEIIEINELFLPFNKYRLAINNSNFIFLASGGQGEGAWRLAHSVNRIIRFALCAFRFAHSPPQKLLIVYISL